jgi:hypothetical protein
MVFFIASQQGDLAFHLVGWQYFGLIPHRETNERLDEQVCLLY